MLPESKNIQTIADNIRSLENQINALDVEIPSHAATDAGKILAVDSEGDLEWKTEYSYTPPAYSSTEEVNTGQKWIDGKDIYMITLNGTTPESGTDDYSISFNEIICFLGIVESSYGNKIDFNKQMTAYGYVTKDKIGIIASSQTTYQNVKFTLTVYYTQPDPVPATETKSKKGGTKK